jgi:hypothetical protein
VLADSLSARIGVVEGELIQQKIVSNQDGLRFPSRLDSQFGSLLGYLAGTGGYGPGSPEGRPTRGALERKQDLEREWGAVRARVDRALREDLAAFNAEVARLGLGGVVPPAPPQR